MDCHFFVMKIKNYFCCLVFGLCGAFAASAKSYVVLELQNGSFFSFQLADKPEFTFTDDEMVINGNAETTYVIDEVKNFRFSDSELTGAPTQSSEEVRVVSLDQNTLQILGANGAPLRLLKSNGTLILSMSAVTDGSTIELPREKGIYIITVGKQSIKVIRK